MPQLHSSPSDSPASIPHMKLPSQVQIPRVLHPLSSQSTPGEARRFELRFKFLPHTVQLSSLVCSVSPPLDSYLFNP